MLEWNENSNRETWLGIAGVLAVFALFMTWRLEGFGWLTLWWFWAVCGMVAALLYWQTAREGWLAAGADWVQVGDRWVETYALAEIRTTVVGLRQALALRDSTNRQLTLPPQAVQGKSGDVGLGLQRHPCLHNQWRDCVEQSPPILGSSVDRRQGST
mgnify:CR=1 FL=1